MQLYRTSPFHIKHLILERIDQQGNAAIPGTWVGLGPPQVPSGVPGGPGISTAARVALVLGLVTCPGVVWVVSVALLGPKMAQRRPFRTDGPTAPAVGAGCLNLLDTPP